MYSDSYLLPVVILLVIPCFTECICNLITFLQLYSTVTFFVYLSHLIPFHVLRYTQSQSTCLFVGSWWRELNSGD